MAASVRIEDEAFSDRRYDRLAKEAGLADADHARGKMAVLWRQCTIEQRHQLPIADVNDVLGPRGVEALVASRLGEMVGDEIRIKGTGGRIEWLGTLRNNGKFGSKGGRPRKGEKPSRVSGAEPLRVRENAKSETPPAPAPAPVTAPAPAPGVFSEAPRGSKSDGEQETGQETGTGRRTPAEPAPAVLVFPDPQKAASGQTVRSGAKPGAMGELVSRLRADHAARFNALRQELGSRVPALVVRPGAECERNLLQVAGEILTDTHDLEQVETVLRHCLAVAEAEARAKGTLRWFGERIWTSASVASLRSQTPEDASGPPKRAKSRLIGPAEPAPVDSWTGEGMNFDEFMRREGL
jgi:hypothetical protein